MFNFLLSSFSLMALIIMLTAALFIFSLKRSKAIADYKHWLIVYYIGLLIWHGMGFISGGLHGELRELTYRYTNTFFNIGLAITSFSYIQVAYMFPVKGMEKERKWVYYLTLILCFVYIGGVAWFHFIQDQQGLSSKTYGSFVNPLAGMFAFITNLWALIVFIRKSIYFKLRKSMHSVPAGLMAVCTAFVIFISALFIYPGAAYNWVIITYTYGVWIVIQAQVLIFIIYSVFPIRIRPKLIGFLFAAVMVILSVVTMVLLPFTTNSETAANIAQRYEDQQMLVRLMIIILGSAFFVLLVFPVILNVNIIRPLRLLMEGIRSADKGDLTVQLPYHSLDEIGIVTRNFNDMVLSLKRSEEKLTRYANTLETQVEERTIELSNSLKELKAAQNQLIQSEKMASLGELTAGIAHEIQNPLNFVNNFSEVNKELIEELKHEKLKAGNGRDEEIENQLLNDIEQNTIKIYHHGKRADSIVKGMLQHSRSSSGKKEPTDINALCDEYLRLAYHGLRAKDKSFNAELKTEFDTSIDKIDIIAQDIGRVVLNLLNNAFYAVKEKQDQLPGFQPIVIVSTRKLNEGIEISIADNGNGIPENILNKIFQPFFTTKPTGQGTGLGLSLAFDIITIGHNGEMKVESIENMGTTFIIHLP